jgi:hypothetical protein
MDSTIRLFPLLENIILLVVAALLTGLAVPLIKARIDEESSRRHKILESDLARQQEVIDAQINFLSNFSELTWKMVFEVFKVSYAFAWETDSVQQKTYADYGPISWELLARIRAIISGGGRLAEPATATDLMKLYDWLIELDDLISIMADNELAKQHSEDSRQQWEEFHQTKFAEAGSKIDGAISSLAKELRLNSRRVENSY